MSQPDSTHSTQLAAEYQVLEALPAARIDLPMFLRVQVRNTSAVAWTNSGDHPVNLSYHWLGRQGQMVEFNGLRTLLPRPLPAGEAFELEMMVEPPPQSGDYLLAIDLVEEQVGWFSLRGVAPLTIPVAVAAADADAPRVCIVNGNCMVDDAVGNHVINQLHAFQARGYQALVLMEVLDQRQPAELRQFFAPITIDQLRDGQATPVTRRAIGHFQSADIYVFNYSTYYPLAEAIQLVGRGVVLFDYHGVTPPELWDGPGVEDLIRGQQQLGLVRYADYAIAHSGYTRTELVASGGISPDRVDVIPYVVPLGSFRPGPRDAELVERYRLEGKVVLLYIGRMAGNKRIIDLVRALPPVAAEHPGATLLLVGDASTPAYTKVVADARAEAARLGVAEQVIFTGPVAHTELHRYYRTCDIYVTSSLHEGFCIPVVEAMACGVPVVGTRAAALPETIGDAGLIAEPQNPSDLAHKVLQLLDKLLSSEKGELEGAAPSRTAHPQFGKRGR